MDKLNAVAQTSAGLITRPGIADRLRAEGVYVVKCYDANGVLKWTDTFENTVVTVGMNLMLDQSLAGSAYTVTGPFMGLISSVSFSAISAADTMASHAGWLEAGSANAPTYSGTRNTCAWSAASAGAKSLSSALTFNMTGTGTVEGAFIVLGSGATSAIANTGGTLLSAGLFSGGTRSVLNGDTLNCSYSLTL